MSRPGPVLSTSGRADAVGSPSLPRVRPSRAAARVVPPDTATGWGPHPDAQAHRHAPLAAAPAPTAPAPVVSVAVVPPPVAGAVGMLAPAPVPRTAPAPGAVDPALLPALAPRPDRPLTFVERVTLMLRRLGSQGRHRTGHSRHHWSMFAPQAGTRRRGGGWTRR